MSGRKSKDKGYRNENNSRKWWLKAGFHCERMPLSGAMGGDFAGDLKLTVGTLTLKGQCKCKADGWKGLYRDLKGHSFLEVKADRQPTLFIADRETVRAMLIEAALGGCVELLEAMHPAIAVSKDTEAA